MNNEQNNTREVSTKFQFESGRVKKIVSALSEKQESLSENVTTNRKNGGILSSKQNLDKKVNRIKKVDKNEAETSHPRENLDKKANEIKKIEKNDTETKQSRVSVKEHVKKFENKDSKSFENKKASGDSVSIKKESVNEPTYYNEGVKENEDGYCDMNNFDVNTDEEIYEELVYVKKENLDEPYYQNHVNIDSELDEKITNSEILYENLKSEDGKNLTMCLDVVAKFIQSEENYVSELDRIVNKYVPYIYEYTIPELRGKVLLLFGNIKEIYKHAQDFLLLLKKNHEEVDSLAMTFINESSKFDEIYPSYGKNYATARTTYFDFFDEIIQKSDQIFKSINQLNLKTALCRPIRRLEEYILFLQRIQEEIIKSSQSPTTNVDLALKIMQEVNKNCEDSIAIGSIKLGNRSLNYVGLYIMKEEFTIKNRKKIVATVFLFNDVIVITQRSLKSPETFEYVDSIRTRELGIDNFDPNDKVFHLKDYSNKTGAEMNTYILEAKTKKIKMRWVSELKDILWQQLKEAKDKKMQETINKNENSENGLSTN